jgi:hypothetical protein
MIQHRVKTSQPQRTYECGCREVFHVIISEFRVFLSFDRVSELFKRHLFYSGAHQHCARMLTHVRRGFGTLYVCVCILFVCARV